MSIIKQDKNQYLDAKNIPKFQFEIVDQELINCIKQLYLQTKTQEKTTAIIKKDIADKISITQLIESFKLIQTTIALPTPLLNSLPTSLKNKEYNDTANPVLNASFSMSNKFSHFVQILSLLNNKIATLEKRLIQSEQKTNLNFKQNVSSLQQQLTSFVKDYRQNFKELTHKFQDNKLQIENKTKEIETNTIWKINECCKRLQERPNIEMVKNSVSQLQIKLTKLIKNDIVSNRSTGSDTIKIQQQIIKLKKQINFTTIQLQSQIKSIQQKIELNYLNLKTYSDQKIDINKKLQNININLIDQMRKIKNFQIKLNQLNTNTNNHTKSIDLHQTQIHIINQKIFKFTKNDQFAKLLEKIDPHELCRMSISLKSLEQRSLATDGRLESLKLFTEAIRSKMEFWRVANGQNPQNKSQRIDIQLMTKLIKQQISNSQFKTKLMKIEQQIIDLTSLKDGVNEILKKINKIHKDNDLTNLKYEIQGLQEYIKKELLILTNRINSLEVNLASSNDKKRPLSARGKQDNRMFASLSTKKLLPVNCISCHQTNTMMVEKDRKTVYNSKITYK